MIRENKHPAFAVVSQEPPPSSTERQRRRPLAKVGAVAGVLAVSLATATAQPGRAIALPEMPASPPPARLDLTNYFPNFNMVDQGYYLEGYNVASKNFDPNNPAVTGRTVLVFEPQGSNFTMSSVAPEDPNAGCQYDSYVWKDYLSYTGTHNACGSQTIDTYFADGIDFIPHFFNPRTDYAWKLQGATDSEIDINGEKTCIGTNEWKSSFLGSFVLANGGTVYHFQTKESQTYSHVRGAPFIPACPSDEKTKTVGWRENFYLTDRLQVVSSIGQIIGYASGVIRSEGGTTVIPKQKAIGTDGYYDSRFIRGWNLPTAVKH